MTGLRESRAIWRDFLSFVVTNLSITPTFSNRFLHRSDTEQFYIIFGHT